MSLSNFERMIQLADETFAVQNDPQQLNVDQQVIKQLQQLHPATVSEYDDGNGPVIWVLLIPTTNDLMNQFISKKISETELLNQTPINAQYDAMYLCSALTLPEFRNKGLTKKVALNAINNIRTKHPIKNLFVWNFSNEGACLAKSISKYEGLPLMERKQ